MGLGGRLPSVKGLPDGVRAHLVPRDKAKVDVVARETPEPGTDPFAVLERILPDPADARWVLAKDRRSAATLLGRFGDEADQVVLALVAAGAVVARYAFHREQLVVGPLDGWRLQPTWQEYAAGLRVHRAEEKDAETRRAERAAESIAELDPGLARTLRDPSRHRVNLPLLVHAAEDLAAGTTHAHAKDFLQHHFKSTKAHRDPARVLRRAGASDDTLDALGIARLPHIGIAGPITLHGEGESVIRSAGFAGPVRLRVPTTGYPATTTAEALVIVENEAAAEILADEMPEVAVLWTPGVPSPGLLRTWGDLAAQAARVAIAPDADLGGVRITRRLLRHVDGKARPAILDPGAVDHDEGRRIEGPYRDRLRTLAGEGDRPWSTLAAACLRRGYVVEQESAILAAVRAWLGRSAN